MLLCNKANHVDDSSVKRKKYKWRITSQLQTFSWGSEAQAVNQTWWTRIVA